MAISLSKVNFKFNDNKKIFNDLTLTIEDGSFIGVVGRNGVGKTTFSYLLNGLIPHEIKGKYSGNILIDGISTKSKPVSFFAKKVGMVFQNPDYGIFNLTIKEELEFGLQNLHIQYSDLYLKKILNSVNLKKDLQLDPNKLSFGEKQKLSIASCLACKNKYLSLDEPSSMLDFESALNLYQLLNHLNKSGITIIVIDHNTEFLFKYCNNLLILGHNGEYIYDKTVKLSKDRKLLKKFGIKPINFYS